MGAVFTQLSMQERRRIEDWWHAKVPVAEMARALKRHKSTIFRVTLTQRLCPHASFWSEACIILQAKNPCRLVAL
jgi:hypothetical protein